MPRGFSVDFSHVTLYTLNDTEGYKVYIIKFTPAGRSDILMLKTTQRIAVMGGTFNPIHYAHLLSAEQVRVGLGYDQVLFIPSARPPHKVADADIIGPEHRYQMALLAIVGNPHFEVSPIELERAGPSYTIETLKTLQKTLWKNNRTGMDHRCRFAHRV